MPLTKEEFKKITILVSELMEKPAEKWAAEKKAYNEGKTIQWRSSYGGGWEDCDRGNEAPLWLSSLEYRIAPAPAFKLTRSIPGFRELAEGEEWHREDFSEDMLAGGTRPLLKGESCEREDEVRVNGIWASDIGDIGFPMNKSHLHTRTRRPLPPLPATERVALTKADIPPGSFIRNTEWVSDSWDAVIAVKSDGLYAGIATRHPCLRTWTELMGRTWQILRPGQADWQPCSKEVSRS